MNNAIEIKNLSFSYEDKIILEDVNFSIKEGDFCLLTGPSGMGKSTLIYILSGIIPNLIYGKYSGEVFINGIDIKNKDASIISKMVGIVLQNPETQIISKYVEDELAFGGENINLKPSLIKKRIDYLTNLLKLPKNGICRKLSGGQKQKLITGSILLMGQKIILLDEPLANLDIKSSIELLDILKSLSKRGYSILIAEHRIDLIVPYINKLFKIEDKTLIEVSDFNEVSSQKRIIEYEDTENVTKNKLLFNVDNLTYEIKGKVILDKLSLKIYEGERILIIGENGAGKTSLLRFLGGLNKAKKANFKHNVLINSKFLKIGSRKWFKNVGVVYQNPNYQLFSKTVRDEIYFNSYSKDYADYIIELFDLNNILDRHPQSLSEGQKRKVSIASILALKPKVLLLDEPTVGQDFNSLKKLVSIINKIHKETHNTIITITHDKRCALSLADRAFFLKDGKVNEITSKDKIISLITNNSKI